jgi:hypothetical protein
MVEGVDRDSLARQELSDVVVALAMLAHAVGKNHGGPRP